MADRTAVVWVMYIDYDDNLEVLIRYLADGQSDVNLRTMVLQELECHATSFMALVVSKDTVPTKLYEE